jgi:hypothetical protein
MQQNCFHCTSLKLRLMCVIVSTVSQMITWSTEVSWCTCNALQAFEQLAHPEYGIMMVDFRPVDCDTKRPIQFDPGYISDKIYEVSKSVAAAAAAAAAV